MKLSLIEAATFLKKLISSVKLAKMITVSDFGETSISADEDLFLPPKGVRGMKTLKKEEFKKCIRVPYILADEANVGQIIRSMKKYILKIPNLKPVQPYNNVSDINNKCLSVKSILINPLTVTAFTDIHETDRIVLAKYGVTASEFAFKDITLSYENWKSDVLLKCILPEDKDCITSYSIIGHVVHVNLRDHLLPYKYVIGEILLDKVSNARTVVNKSDIIDNTYRNFKMEILAGTTDMLVKLRENGCSYEFDFSSVYWNPRLSTEHERIVSKLKENDVLYDVFSGVGPFAIPAAKKKCAVLANDLNPEAHKWLKHNCKLNKVEERIKCFNKDGRQFICEDIKNDIKNRWQNPKYKNNQMYITMNLPALAVNFLSSFNGLFSKEELCSEVISSFPIVHVYCFIKGDNFKQRAIDLVEENLSHKLQSEHTEVFFVRNVSLNKEMLRVTFPLSSDILFGNLKRKCEFENEFVKKSCSIGEVKSIQKNHD